MDGWTENIHLYSFYSVDVIMSVSAIVRGERYQLDFLVLEYPFAVWCVCICVISNACVPWYCTAQHSTAPHSTAQHRKRGRNTKRAKDVQVGKILSVEKSFFIIIFSIVESYSTLHFLSSLSLSIYIYIYISLSLSLSLSLVVCLCLSLCLSLYLSLFLSLSLSLSLSAAL